MLPNAVPATVSVARTIIANNLSAGLNFQSGGASSPITALVNNNTIVRNLWGVYARSNFAGGVVSGTLSENLIGVSDNAGIAAVDTGVLLVLDRNTVTHHGVGVQRTGGAVIETRSSNAVRENGTNTVGTPYTAVGAI